MLLANAHGRALSSESCLTKHLFLTLLLRSRRYVESINNCETCAVGFASLGDTPCSKCEGLREYADEPEQPVCKLRAPGEMPSADNTDVVDCPKGTDLEGCVCPKNTFLTLDGKLCDEFEDGNEGVDLSEEGMALETLRVLPGYWRTNNRSSDVRPCPVAEACVGWNVSASYCREGHTGPYCNLCEDGYVRMRPSSRSFY